MANLCHKWLQLRKTSSRPQLRRYTFAIFAETHVSYCAYSLMKCSQCTGNYKNCAGSLGSRMMHKPLANILFPTISISINTIRRNLLWVRGVGCLPKSSHRISWQWNLWTVTCCCYIGCQSALTGIAKPCLGRELTLCFCCSSIIERSGRLCFLAGIVQLTARVNWLSSIWSQSSWAALNPQVYV